MGVRLKQIRNHLGLTQPQMGKFLNCGSANVSMIETGNAPMSEKHKEMLVQKLNVNPEWLEVGRGPMILPGDPDRESAPWPGGGIPVYDLNKLSGLSNLLNRTRRRPSASGYISIPDLPRCDGAVHIVGDSMYPVLRSGDLVLYRRTAGPAEIFWGEMYLVSVATSTEDRIVVGYIGKSKREGWAVLSGENPAFSDKEIELSKINAIALVKATIRINSVK